MKEIHPYFNFNGNCEKAFHFYKSIFGGEFLMLQKFKDIPQGVDMPPMSDVEKEQIMHVSLPLENGTILMGCDVPEHVGKTIIGNNVSISITPDSIEEADRLFSALSSGGAVTMPIAKQFWNAY